ncbi:MAG: PspC domain-containing protein [Actinomycetes bacterium]
MTENDTGYAPPPPGFTPPPSPPPAPPRPALRRTTGDANVLGGVAGGIARSLGIDPILVRVTFVVLAIFGGSGVVLYLAGWLFIPEEGRADSTGERFFREHNALAIAAAVLVGIFLVGPMLAWGLWGDGPGFGGIVLLFLVIAGVVALTRRSDRATTSPAPAPPQPPPPHSGQAVPYAGAAGPTAPTLALPTTPPPPPPPPKDRSALGRLTFGLALLVAGALIALNLADIVAVDAVTVLAASLGVVALGLLVGTFFGRSRWLIALGVALTLALIPMAAVPEGFSIDGGTGDRLYRVTSETDLLGAYELGAGTLVLDLRRVNITTSTDIDASVGAGELTVLLPDDVRVDAAADVGVGTITFPGSGEQSGFGMDRTWSRFALAPPPVLTLDLSVGLGDVTVIDDTQEVTP